MRTRLPQYYVVHTHESATFWRENGISIIILVQVFGKNSIDTETSYQILEVFIIILRAQERSLPPSTSITVLTFLVEKGKLVVGAYI